MTFSDPIVDDEVLVRDSIQSPDYVPGVSGWAVKADGTAEFTNADLRGALLVGQAGADGSVYVGPAAAAPDTTTDAGILRGLGLDAGMVYRYGTGSRVMVQGLVSEAGGTGATLTTYLLGADGVVLGRPVELVADVAGSRAYLNLGQGCDDVTVQGRSMARGPVDSVWFLTDSVAFGAAETELMRLVSTRLTAGRAYAVRYGQLAQSDTAATRPLFRLRDAAGFDLGEYGRVPTPVAGEPAAAQGVVYLANRRTVDVFPDIRLTGVTTAGTCFLRTTAKTPRFLALDDVGAAEDYPYAPAV